MVDITSAARTAWVKSGIPLRFQPAMDNEDLLLANLALASPKGATRKWSMAFREGQVLRSEDMFWCGKGLYLVGKYAADLIGAATMQALILEGHAKSGLYINVEALLEAEAPDGQHLGDKRWVDLLLIKGVGSHHLTATNWSNNVINGIVRRRYDEGLPTIITTKVPPQESGLADDLYEQAFITVLFEE